MRNLFLFLFLFLSFSQNILSEDILTKLLVATPNMPDPRFKETVIFMFYHNKEGAAGLVINKPLSTIPIIELLENNNITLPKKIIKNEITLYWGGPVYPENIFIIHSSDYNSNNPIFLNENLIVTQSAEILSDIATNKGPKKYLILSGIAAWDPGQLDMEIDQGSWDKKNNSYLSIFNNENEMWNRMINSKDI